MTDTKHTDEEVFPLPQPDDVTVDYWRAAKLHDFSIQRCRACDRLQHFPGPLCSTCQSTNLTYEPVSGNGNVYSFVVVHHVVRPWFKDRAPYVVAWIELSEQKDLRVLSDIVGCDPAEVRIGSAVEVVYDDVTPEVTIPRFRLRR